MPKNYSVTWTPPASDGGSPITGHDVGYTPAGGSETVEATGSTAASHIITGLTDGTEYSVRVRAENGVGKGPWSDAVAQIAALAPEQVTGLAVDATGDGTIDLSWTAPATGNVTDYVVEYTPSGGSAATVNVGSAATSYQITGLTNDTEYSVRVAASNAGLVGAYSSAVTGTPSAAAEWTQFGADIVGEAQNDNVGDSLGMSADGSVIAVGAADTGTGGWNGPRVYERSGGSLVMRGSPLDSSGWKKAATVALNSDGTRAAIVGDTALVVFSWDGTAWSQMGSISGTFNGAPAISADGNVVVGRWDQTNYIKAFSWDGTAWSQLGTTITVGGSGVDPKDAIAISNTGTRIAYGQTQYSGSWSRQGRIYMYDWDGTAWSLHSTITGEAGPLSPELGSRLSLSADGNVVAAGAGNYDSFRGQAAVWDWNGSAWVIRDNYFIGAGYDEVGSSVALNDSGSVVAIGARRANAASGTTTVYSWDGAAWSAVGSPLAGGDAVALNALGTSVAVGQEGYEVTNAEPYNVGRVGVFDS